MRYIVIGAGAVGGTIGGRLFQAGHDVLLVARGAHHDAIRRDGLRLLTPGSARTLDVPVTRGPVRLRDGDVLILAVKSQDTVAALDPWSRDAPVVCAQNGVANERMALRRFERVYGMCVWLPASHLEPGVVAAHGAPKSGLLQLGRYPRGADELSERIAGDLSESSFAGVAVPDVMRWKYAKLLGNLGNAYEALCGHAPGHEPIMKRVRAEGRAVLDAAGIAYASPRRSARRGAQVEVRPIEGWSAAAAPPGRAWPAPAARSRPTTSTARSSCSAVSWASPPRPTGCCSARPIARPASACPPVPWPRRPSPPSSTPRRAGPVRPRTERGPEGQENGVFGRSCRTPST
nr:hypothetical protein GCM10020093_052070 [Planobispora longispora]